MEFKTVFTNWTELVNGTLDNLVIKKDTPGNTIYGAMRYSLMAGGKRLRPVLALAVCDMAEVDVKEVLPFACAIEMIHTYSLIHDDLPAMDNDDYRRGRLTSHKVYGEAMAILAGDALLNMAFETMLQHSLQHDTDSYAKLQAMSIIANASGVSGMIGGQVVDMESEGKCIPIETLEYMHKCKTGALIKAPIMAAAVLCRLAEEQLKALELYADRIGLAFQIKDDILDVEGSLEDMGKKAGSDAAKEKSTFVSLYGLEKSKGLLEEVTREAVNSLMIFGGKAWFLKALAEYLVKRNS